MKGSETSRKGSETSRKGSVLPDPQGWASKGNEKVEERQRQAVKAQGTGSEKAVEGRGKAVEKQWKVKERQWKVKERQW